MGLDMYLQKKIFVKNLEGLQKDSKDSFDVTLKRGGKKVPGFKSGRVVEITEEVMYWRKANQIHRWFVENVQGGADDCRTYEVSAEQLTDLLNLCEEVLADRSRAMELLPPQGGFFFGSTELDEFYFEDLERTVKALKAEIGSPQIGKYGDSYEYDSSW